MRSATDNEVILSLLYDIKTEISIYESAFQDIKPARAGESPLMEKVLDTIELFNDQTDGQIPIALTDTQSPMNTASLIVRTEELLMGCYSNPEAVHHLLRSDHRPDH